MAKRLRIILFAVLSALVLLCAAALLLPTATFKASADEITTSGISDGNFGFVPGASVKYDLFSAGVDPSAADFDLDSASFDLGYYFRLENVDYKNLSDQVSAYRNWWGTGREDNVFIYEFTLFSGNRDGDGAGSLGTGNPQTSVLVVLYPLRNEQTFYGYIAVKDYYGTAGVFYENLLTVRTGDSSDTYNNVAEKGRTFDVNGVNRKFGGGYTVVKSGFLDGKSNINFNVSEGIEGLVNIIPSEVISPFSYYFIRARYLFQTADFVGILGTSYKKEYGEVFSSSRSVAKVLENMQNAGVDFTETFGSNAQYANEILISQATQRVRVKYLEEIPGTPYATHKYAFVDVPVLSETVYLSDVEKALDKDLHKCLDSNAYCFKKTTDGDGDVYELYYLKNVWLRSATVDGNFFDYFLDINQSYKDVYLPYVNAEILTNDVYEWVYSTKILNRFPALQNYRFNEIYGYFGLVVVPETYTLNSALKTMFDVNTSKIGVISNFTFERSLPYDGYQELLTNYNYGFLSKVWSEVSGFISGSEHNATYYVIYSEPGTENALIGEGGQTNAENPGSVVQNEVIKPAGEIFGNAWNGIVGFFKNLTQGTQAALLIALFVAAGVAIYVIYKKITKRSKK